MTKVLPPYFGDNKNLDVVPLDVPDSKVRAYVDKGWQLAEGESLPAEPKKRRRELSVDPKIVETLGDGRVIRKGEQDSPKDTAPNTVVETIKGDGANDPALAPVQVGEHGQQVVVKDVTGVSNLPTLTGKTKEELLVIAATEHIEVDSDLNKPDVKAAIEKAREDKGTKPATEEPDITEDDDESESGDTSKTGE